MLLCHSSSIWISPDTSDIALFAVIYSVGPLEETQKPSVISLAYTPSPLKLFFSKILKKAQNKTK